jgi:hypothetical protein
LAGDLAASRYSLASGDSDICGLKGVAPFGTAVGTELVQAHPLPCMHLVAQLMQLSPQAQLPLQIMQQPVESSWHALDA